MLECADFLDLLSSVDPSQRQRSFYRDRGTAAREHLAEQQAEEVKLPQPEDPDVSQLDEFSKSFGELSKPFTFAQDWSKQISWKILDQVDVIRATDDEERFEDATFVYDEFSTEI